MGAAGSSVYYNLKLRHPSLDMPIIDYDLALLFQPMLMLGISIGVAFNVIFADWMVTVLLIFLFIGKHSLTQFLVIRCDGWYVYVDSDFHWYSHIDQGIHEGCGYMEEGDTRKKGTLLSSTFFSSYFCNWSNSLRNLIFAGHLFLNFRRQPNKWNQMVGCLIYMYQYLLTRF